MNKSSHQKKVSNLVDYSRFNELLFKVGARVKYTYSRKGVIVDRYKISDMEEVDYTIEMDDKSIVSVSGNKYINFINGKDEKKSIVEYNKPTLATIIKKCIDSKGLTFYVIELENGCKEEVVEKDLEVIVD